MKANQTVKKIVLIQKMFTFKERQTKTFETTFLLKEMSG